MQELSSEPVSELLAKWRAGDEESLRRLVPLVYNELRRPCRAQLSCMRPLRLMKGKPVQFENRAHFFAVSAQLMRQILVEYARRQNAAKRDAGYRVTLDGAVALANSRSLDLVALDDALNGLAKLDPQQSRIVELRFFGGLSIEETSHVLGVSPATVKRDWTTARIWLYHESSRTHCDDA
jgi:RNA polymerase sigma factor (TIGR02999 family)